jgi:putative aldouronate transport system substrate-binding protein
MKNSLTRILALLVSAVMMLGLAACTGAPAASTAAATTAAESAAAETASAEATVSAEATATAEAPALLDASVPPPQDPFGKFDPPIEVTMIHTSNDGAFWIPQGDDISNNIYTRTREERLGIKYKFLWTCPGSQAEEKVNILMASGDLPDMLSVNRTNF